MKINPSFDEITNYLINSKDSNNPDNIDFQKVSLVEYLSRIDFKELISERTINYLRLVDNLGDINSKCFAKGFDKTPINKLRELRINYLKEVDSKAYDKDAVRNEFHDGFRDFFDNKILEDILKAGDTGLPLGIGESIDDNAIEGMGDFYIKNFKEVELNDEFKEYLVSIKPYVSNPVIIDSLLSKATATRDEITALEESFVKKLIGSFVPVSDYNDKVKLVNDFNNTAKNVSNGIKSLKGELHESMYKFSGVQLGSDNPVFISLKKLADSQGLNSDWHTTLTSYFLINELRNQFEAVNEPEPEVKEFKLRSAKRTCSIIESAFWPFLSEVITISKDGVPILFSSEDVYSNFQEDSILRKFNESWSRVTASKGRKESDDGTFMWDESKLKNSDKYESINKEFLAVIRELANDLTNSYQITFEPDVLWLERNLENGLINNASFNSFILSKLMESTGQEFNIESLNAQKELIKKVNKFYNKKFSEIKVSDNELINLLKNNDTIKERVIDLALTDKDKMSRIIDRLYKTGGNIIDQTSDDILKKLKEKNSDEIIDYIIGLKLLDDKSVALLNSEKSRPVVDYKTLERKLNLPGLIADSLKDNIVNLEVKTADNVLNEGLNNEIQNYILNLVANESNLLSNIIDTVYKNNNDLINGAIEAFLDKLDLGQKSSDEIIDLLKKSNVITDDKVLKLKQEGVSDYNESKNAIRLISESLKEQLKNKIAVKSSDDDLNGFFNDFLYNIELKNALPSLIKDDDNKKMIYEGLIKDSFVNQLTDKVLTQLTGKNSDEIIDYLANLGFMKKESLELIANEKSTRSSNFSEICRKTLLPKQLSDSLKNRLNDSVNLVTDNKEVNELLNNLNKGVRAEVYNYGGASSLESLLLNSELSFEWVKKDLIGKDGKVIIDKGTKKVLFEAGLKSIIKGLSGADNDYKNVIYGLKVLNNHRYDNEADNKENIQQITSSSIVINKINSNIPLEDNDVDSIKDVHNLLGTVTNYAANLNYNFMKKISKQTKLQLSGETKNTFYFSLLKGLNNFFGFYQDKLIGTITDLISISNELSNNNGKSVHELLKEKMKSDYFLNLLINNDSFDNYVGKALSQIIGKRSQLIDDKEKLKEIIKSFNRLTNQNLIMDWAGQRKDKDELMALCKKEGVDYTEVVDTIRLIEESFDKLDNNLITPYDFRNNLRKKFIEINDTEFQLKFERIIEREIADEKQKLSENNELLLDYVKKNFIDANESLAKLKGNVEKYKTIKNLSIDTLKNKFSDLSAQITEEKLNQPASKLNSLKLNSLSNEQLNEILSKDTNIIKSLYDVKAGDLSTELSNYFITNNLIRKKKSVFKESLDGLSDFIDNYQNKNFKKTVEDLLIGTNKRIDKKVAKDFFNEINLNNNMPFMNHVKKINGSVKESYQNANELINELNSILIATGNLTKNDNLTSKEMLANYFKEYYKKIGITDKKLSELNEEIKKDVLNKVNESLNKSLKCFEIPFIALKESDNFLNGIIKESHLVEDKGINEFIIGLFGKPYDTWYEALKELKNDKITLAEKFIAEHEQYKTRDISELIGKIKILNELNNDYNTELDKIENDINLNRKLVSIMDNKDHDRVKPINQSKVRLTKLESLTDKNLKTNVSSRLKNAELIDIKELLNSYKSVKGLWR